MQSALGNIAGSPCGFDCNNRRQKAAAEKPIKRPPMMRNGKKAKGYLP